MGYEVWCAEEQGQALLRNSSLCIIFLGVLSREAFHSLTLNKYRIGSLGLAKVTGKKEELGSRGNTLWENEK